MPPGVYSSFPLSTPFEETQALPPLYPSLWHLDGNPCFEGKVDLAAARAGREVDRAHLAILLSAQAAALASPPALGPPEVLTLALSLHAGLQQLTQLHRAVLQAGHGSALPPPRHKMGCGGHTVCRNKRICSLHRNGPSQPRGKLLHRH